MKRLIFFLLLVPIIFIAAYLSESGVEIPNTAVQAEEIQENTLKASTSTVVEDIKQEVQEAGKEVIKDAIKETLEENLPNF